MSGIPTGAPASQPLIQVRNLRVSFPHELGDVQAVRDVSFDVAQGERVAILGESGSGKTISVLSILGLQPANVKVSGAMTFQGNTVDLANHAEIVRTIRHSTGIVFQDSLTSLNPIARVGTQLVEALTLRGWKRGLAFAEAIRMLGQVGISDAEARMRAYPHELSGGMRQRVMITMALLAKPSLLIADEPTTALDVTIQAQVIDLIRSVQAANKMGLILITHDLALAAEVCDRALVMYAGYVVEDVPMSELLRRPRHPYARALLRAIPRLDRPRTLPLQAIDGEPPSPRQHFAGCPFAPRCDEADSACSAGMPPVESVSSTHAVRCIHHARVFEASPAKDVVTADRVADQAGNVHVALELSGITKRYGSRRAPIWALAGVNLTLNAGETLGVVGESGSGKSTIAKIAVGLDSPTDGDVRMGDRTAAKAGKAPIQMVFQDPSSSLDPLLRILRSVREPLDVGAGMAREVRMRTVLDVLAEVGLGAYGGNAFPPELSGGQKQRASIARALATLPPVVICDEAVTALDVSIRAQILNLLRRVQDVHGTSFLFISHDLSTVAYMSHRIMVMYLGKVVEIGSTQDLVNRPAHPYTSALLSAIPQLQQGAKRRPHIRLMGDPPSIMRPPPGCRFNTRCALATDRCRSEEPMLRAIADQHFAACHYAPIDETVLATEMSRVRSAS